MTIKLLKELDTETKDEAIIRYCWQTGSLEPLHQFIQFPTNKAIMAMFSFMPHFYVDSMLLGGYGLFYTVRTATSLVGS